MEFNPGDTVQTTYPNITNKIGEVAVIYVEVIAIIDAQGEMSHHNKDRLKVIRQFEEIEHKTHKGGYIMTDKMNKKMIEVANEALEKCDEYFHEYAKEHSKKGFVWIKNDETNQLVVYTRGEYTNQIMDFLSTLK